MWIVHILHRSIVFEWNHLNTCMASRIWTLKRITGDVRWTNGRAHTHKSWRKLSTVDTATRTFIPNYIDNWLEWINDEFIRLRRTTSVSIDSHFRFNMSQLNNYDAVFHCVRANICEPYKSLAIDDDKYEYIWMPNINIICVATAICKHIRTVISHKHTARNNCCVRHVRRSSYGTHEIISHQKFTVWCFMCFSAGAFYQRLALFVVAIRMQNELLFDCFKHSCVICIIRQSWNSLLTTTIFFKWKTPTQCAFKYTISIAAFWHRKYCNQNSTPNNNRDPIILYNVVCTALEIRNVAII